jgi:hypothetical protein
VKVKKTEGRKRERLEEKLKTATEVNKKYD